MPTDVQAIAPEDDAARDPADHVVLPRRRAAATAEPAELEGGGQPGRAGTDDNGGFIGSRAHSGLPYPNDGVLRLADCVPDHHHRRATPRLDASQPGTVGPSPSSGYDLAGLKGHQVTEQESEPRLQLKRLLALARPELRGSPLPPSLF